MVRITANNDWVIFCILGSALLYLLMFRVLLREVTIREFLLQSLPESSNNFLSWLIISIIFCTNISVLVSQYIPIVPQWIANHLSFGGIGLNKFGYTFCVFIIFYFVKILFTYFYYQSIGQMKKWGHFVFASQKFFFVLSLVVMTLCIVHFYFPIDALKIFPYYLIFLVLVAVAKVFYYLFYKESILPEEWYFKILYICTLQFIPLLVFWKMLFL